ncbi:hypothetical protein AVEN_203810-1 [Araneus ventricosus]|uniref:Uncharacterized protein n=1 Tax=Araneus ventricosus TaxID=182803 RepID=A0A4Y2R4X8_ARAVE|nr:hypothetical protein AVEN_203810-1 [Araneus ventricosus]
MTRSKWGRNAFNAKAFLGVLEEFVPKPPLVRGLYQRMYSVKKGHFHRRNVNQRPQRYLVPGEEYARQEKQLPDVSLMAIQASRSFS